MKSMLKTCVLLVVSAFTYADDSTGITANNVYNIAANVKSKVLSEEQKPKLEDYSNYNNFLHAMYLYNKAQEDNIKPRIVVNLPNTPSNQPEYTTIGDNSDVTTRGEDMSALKPLADDNK